MHERGKSRVGIALASCSAKPRPAIQALACLPSKSICAAGDGSAWLDNTFDLVLSSGFLAFASHSGFLKAVNEAEVNVGGVMGTSAGALSGSLYSAGYSPKKVGIVAR